MVYLRFVYPAGMLRKTNQPTEALEMNVSLRDELKAEYSLLQSQRAASASRPQLWEVSPLEFEQHSLFHGPSGACVMPVDVQTQWRTSAKCLGFETSTRGRARAMGF